MKDEIIESIFGCLERIEEKLDKKPVQTGIIARVRTMRIWQRLSCL